MSTKTKLERLAEHYGTADTAHELEQATPAVQPDAPPLTERMTTFAVRLPVTLLERAREVAEQRNVTTSAIIRRWVEAGVAQDGADVGDRTVPVQALLELIGRAPRRSTGR